MIEINENLNLDDDPLEIARYIHSSLKQYKRYWALKSYAPDEFTVAPSSKASFDGKFFHATATWEVSFIVSERIQGSVNFALFVDNYDDGLRAKTRTMTLEPKQFQNLQNYIQKLLFKRGLKYHLDTINPKEFGLSVRLVTLKDIHSGILIAQDLYKLFTQKVGGRRI